LISHMTAYAIPEPLQTLNPFRVQLIDHDFILRLHRRLFILKPFRLKPPDSR
jgi:hypothetical protein